MKVKQGRIFTLAGLGFSLAATVLPIPAGQRRLPAPTGVPPAADLAGVPLPPKIAHPKIDARLWLKVRAAGRAGRDVSSAGLTRVVIETSGRVHATPARAGLSPFRLMIEAFGGTVERISGRYIQALLPPPAVEFLAADPEVERLRLPETPLPAAVYSEGVARSGASAWSDLPSYRAPEDPVKIAVLDTGFLGYQTLLGSELPSSVVASSFRADGNLAAGTAHGTACAEIIHDMAPDAKIYLVNFSTDVEQHAAVEYLISEKVDIISYALTWPGAGAGNGTGPICEDVKRCAAAGILWVGAAGDEAESHWESAFIDSNGDLFQDFGPGDEILQWLVPADTWTGATLTWNDWGTWTGSSYGNPTQDYDMLFWRWNGSAWELLEYCDDWQSGTAGQIPVERTSLWRTNVATYYGVSILKFDASVDNTLEIVVQGNSGAIEYDVPLGSVGIPADAAESFSIGATDAETDVLETFSSRGPTSDGRIKPDLTAFSRVTTAALGPKAFAGTSAAAPHVAGAVGLLMSKTPYSASQIRTILEGRALDLGAAGRDNLFGYGRLFLK